MKILPTFYQYVFRQKLFGSKKNLFRIIKDHIFNQIFLKIIKIRDPLIPQQIGNFTLEVPLSHKLPFLLHFHPLYSRNLGRIAKCLHSLDSKLQVIDIGANIGDSVALIKSEIDVPILCIEGEKFFFDILQKNAMNFKNVICANKLIGPKEQFKTSKVLITRGTARIDTHSDSLYSQTFVTLDNILQQYPAYQNSKLLKIDTDGFDGQILRTATNFLMETQPVIFFEYDPYFLTKVGDNGMDLMDFLLNQGYEYIIVYDNIGYLLCTLDLKRDMDIFKDLHIYFSGKNGKKYCDICAFYKSNVDTFLHVSNLEKKFFKDWSSGNENSL